MKIEAKFDLTPVVNLMDEQLEKIEKANKDLDLLKIAYAILADVEDQCDGFDFFDDLTEDREIDGDVVDGVTYTASVTVHVEQVEDIGGEYMGQREYLLSQDVSLIEFHAISAWKDGVELDNEKILDYIIKAR